jgi:chromosome partitioning protein
MPVIAISNQKGGVGKTQTTVNLAAALADSGYDVLVIDADPQASASAALNFDLEREYTSLYDVMRAASTRHPAPLLRAVWAPDTHLALIPSDIRLADLEIELLQVYNKERVLSKLVSALSRQPDFILIDCPPSLGWLTVNALTAADYVLAPVIPDYVSLRGLGSFRNTVERIQAELNRDLTVLGALLTLVKSQTLAHREGRKEIAAFCADWGVPLLPMEVPYTIRAADAVAAGVPLVRHDPPNPASQAYQALAAHIAQEVFTHV